MVGLSESCLEEQLTCWFQTVPHIPCYLGLHQDQLPCADRRDLKQAYQLWLTWIHFNKNLPRLKNVKLSYKWKHRFLAWFLNLIKIREDQLSLLPVEASIYHWLQELHMMTPPLGHSVSFWRHLSPPQPTLIFSPVALATPWQPLCYRADMFLMIYFFFSAYPIDFEMVGT